MEQNDKIKIIRPNPGGQRHFVRSNVDVCFFGGVLAGGKLLSINELVLTPDGWVRNGDLKSGDVVCTPFGKPTRILQVFPHRDKAIYTLRTSDGRECMCGLEHLWEVRTRKQVHKYRKHGENKNFMVLTTQELIEGMSRGKKYYLPIPRAQEFGEKQYVIPPYVLGVLIGDGCISKIQGNCFALSNPEADIIERVSKLSECTRVRESETSYTKYFYTPHIGEYKRYLRSVGLETYSKDKFIPQEYLWGSIEQRKQLLFGLMDTDGNVEKKNKFRFTTTSPRLAKDFIYLCRSLGYIATTPLDKRTEKYHSGYCARISVQTDDIIFSSKKHLEKYERNKAWIDENGFYERTKDHVLIESITYKCNEDALCILVEDKDHLYIAGDFVTTHNTFGAVLSMAEGALDPRFRGCFVRRTLGELKVAGGVVEKFREVYGNNIDVKMSDSPLIKFKGTGATVECRQIQNEERQKVIEQWKGSEYDLIAFEELTGFSWETFTYLMSRNRGKAKNTGHIIATTNPKKSHWVRKFIDAYIGYDGQIIPEMNGVVRFFYIKGEKVEDVVWGDTKKEVYEKCKADIDKKLKSFGGDATYENLIKSFTFILGKTSENKAMLENNPDYVGSIAATGGKQSKILIEGNWDVDEDEDDSKAPIPHDSALRVFDNEPCVNGDKWITADLADVGKDNSVFLAWNGFHIFDILVLSESTPRQNAEWLQMFAEKHGIPDAHIIYDATRALYINDYIQDAQPYISSRAAMGMFARGFRHLKDECFFRLAYVIKNGMLSFEDSVAKKRYEHSQMKQSITIQEEFLDECYVVRFLDLVNGKKTLVGKKEMNAKLGKNRSMDLLDPCAMRMYPTLRLKPGDELEATRIDTYNMVRPTNEITTGFNVFDERNWC